MMYYVQDFDPFPDDTSLVYDGMIKWPLQPKELQRLWVWTSHLMASNGHGQCDE